MDPMKTSSNRAVAELVFAASLWGFGFIALKWGLLSFTPFWLTGLRFSLTFVIAAPLIFLSRRMRLSARYLDFQLSIVPGLLLGLTLILQTYGLQYTTVAKSGFITCLYAVFVPLLGWLFLGNPLKARHWFWVFLSLCGAAAICEVQSLDLNRGDGFTFLCAIVAAIQILEVGRTAHQTHSPLLFTLWQSAWASVPPLLGALVMDPWPSFSNVHPLSVAGLLFLSLGATLLAFGIQARAQKILDSSIVSLLFLLESPFGAVFGVIFLGELLNLGQLAGGGLILLAALGSVVTDRPRAA
jgi:drug/metabolite transporter (DMT)-like permease